MRQPRVRSLRQGMAPIERVFVMAAMTALFRTEVPRRIACIGIFTGIVLLAFGITVPVDAQLLRSPSETQPKGKGAGRLRRPRRAPPGR